MSNTAGSQAAILRAIAPNLPLPSNQTEDWPIELPRLAVAIAQVLHRVKPIALIFYEVQLADPGTSELLSLLNEALPNDVYILVLLSVTNALGSTCVAPNLGKVSRPDGTPVLDARGHHSHKCD